jgi:gliding motility-associated protein GldC
MAATHTSKIDFTIELDENRIPEKIHWSAPDGGVKRAESKSIMLSVWDPEVKEALRIDLWTKDMPVEEMKVFFYQTLTAMADTFERATNDDKMAATMRDFTDYFAEKLAIK